MAYIYQPSQFADISIPANAMDKQLDRGSDLTKNYRDEVLQRQKLMQEDALEREKLAQDTAYNRAYLDYRNKELENDIKSAKDKEDQDFWQNIISTGIDVGSKILPFLL